MFLQNLNCFMGLTYSAHNYIRFLWWQNITPTSRPARYLSEPIKYLKSVCPFYCRWFAIYSSISLLIILSSNYATCHSCIGCDPLIPHGNCIPALVENTCGMCNSWMKTCGMSNLSKPLDRIKSGPYFVTYVVPDVTRMMSPDQRKHLRGISGI